MGLGPKESKPSFPQKVTAPKGAPNVVLILMDDIGFGETSTFGGPVPTPALDKLAANGLRWVRHHAGQGHGHHWCHGFGEIFSARSQPEPVSRGSGLDRPCPLPYLSPMQFA
jgi:hypothetical protein